LRNKAPRTKDPPCWLHKLALLRIYVLLPARALSVTQSDPLALWLVRTRVIHVDKHAHTRIKSNTHTHKQHAKTTHTKQADGANSLSDLLCDAVVWYALVESRKDATPDRPWGRGKLEPLGALVVGGLLLATGTGIGYAAIGAGLEMWGGEAADAAVAAAAAAAAAAATTTAETATTTSSSSGMMAMTNNITSLQLQYAALGVSSLSIIAKEALFHYTIHAGTKANSAAVVANAWQHRSDAIVSSAVLVGLCGTMVSALFTHTQTHTHKLVYTREFFSQFRTLTLTLSLFLSYTHKHIHKGWLTNARSDGRLARRWRHRETGSFAPTCSLFICTHLLASHTRTHKTHAFDSQSLSLTLSAPQLHFASSSLPIGFEHEFGVSSRLE